MTPTSVTSIAFDYATGAHGDNCCFSTITWSHTVTGSNTYLLVVAGTSSVDIGVHSVSSATYNGVAMDVLGSAVNDAFLSSPFMPYGGFTLFGLKNPDSGTHSVVVTNGYGNFWETISASYTSVNQTTPTGSFVEAHGLDTTSTLTATSASGELVVDFSYVLDQSLSGTADVSQTERLSSTGWRVDMAVSDKPGAASTSMTWTHDSHQWELIAVPLKP